MNIFDPLSIPLGKLMHFIYYTISFENYGFALIIFTILTRLAMLPLTIKQYQGTAKMQQLNPKLEELRRQYGSDKKRLQEETMKLYQEEKVNPAGGCLPLLIQFPILFSLYPVITRPLRYMLGKTQDQIAALTELYRGVSGKTQAVIQEMEILNFFKNNAASLASAQADNLLVPNDLINMGFFGLDLSRTPTYNPDILFGEQSAIYLPLLLIPIIGVVSTYISGRFSMASSAAQSSQSAQNQQASSMGKSMQILGPVMTLIFSFQLPAGVLVYWIAGYLIQIIQQLFINKYVFKLDNIFTGKSAGDAQQGMGASGRNGAQRSITGQTAANGGQALIGQDGKTMPGQASKTEAKTGNVRAQETQPAAGSLKTFTYDGAGDGQEDLYDGNSLVNKVISAVGGTGGTGARDPGTGGIVHGGMYRPSVKIPGVTVSDDDYDEDEEEGEVSEPDGDAPRDTGELHSASAGGVSAGDATPHKNIDMRSNTQKNYGSQKKHKKKK